MKNPCADQLFEYSKVCSERGHNQLAEITLIDSANLGNNEAASQIDKVGLEVRPLKRWERKIINSLNEDIYGFSRSDWGVNLYGWSAIKKIKKVIRKIKKEPRNVDKDEYVAPWKLGNYGEGVRILGGIGLVILLVSMLFLLGVFTSFNDKNPEHNPPTSEQNSNSVTVKNKHLEEGVPGSKSTLEKSILTEEAAVPHKETFEELKAEHVRGAQKRLGLAIDSVYGELTYHQENATIENIDENYSDLILLLNEEKESIKLKLIAIEDVKKAYNSLMDFEEKYPDLDDAVNRIKKEIVHLDTHNIHNNASELMDRLKAADPDFYRSKNQDLIFDLSLLKIKTSGMPSDRFTMFSALIDQAHPLYDLHGYGMLYMPNITPKIKQEKELRESLFAFLMSKPIERLGLIRKQIIEAKAEQRFYYSVRANLNKLREEYERMNDVYPLNNARLDELQSLKLGLLSKRDKIKEWEVTLNDSHKLVGLFQKAEDPKVAVGSYSNSFSAGHQSEAVPEIRTHEGYLNASESERKAWSNRRAQQYPGVTGEDIKEALDAFYYYEPDP